MKLGIEVRIDVKKIEKMRLYQGEKGTYLTMTTWIDTDNKDEYGNNGFIAHKTEKNEETAPILGNSRVFWTDQDTSPHKQYEAGGQPQQHAHLYKKDDDELDDSIPF